MNHVWITSYLIVLGGGLLKVPYVDITEVFTQRSILNYYINFSLMLCTISLLKDAPVADAVPYVSNNPSRILQNIMPTGHEASFADGRPRVRLVKRQ